MSKVTAMETAVHSNLAICYFQTESFEEAIRAATVALKNDPENVKARYRRALACLETKDRSHWQQAAEDLEALAKASPNRKDIRQSLAEARKKLNGALACK